MQLSAALQRIAFGLIAAVAFAILLSQPASAVTPGIPWGADPRLAPKLVRGGALTWYHSWGNSRPTSTLSERGLQWVPTFWGQSKISNWHSVERYYKHRGKRPKFILAQNEPDIRTQANTSPKAAARQWMKELHPWARRGVKVGSAQICWDTSKWLDPFLHHLRQMGGKPHFCAAHYYGSPRDMGRFKRYVRRVRSTCRKHGINNVWLTEIGVMSSHHPSQSETNHFAREVMRWLDTQSYVKRAAWIGAFKVNQPYDGFMSQKNAFFNADGSLRTLGKIFGHGNFWRRSEFERHHVREAAIEANATLIDSLAPLDDPRGQTDLDNDDDEDNHDPNDDAYWDAKIALETANDPAPEDDDDDDLSNDDDDDAFDDGFLADLPDDEEEATEAQATSTAQA